MSSPKPVRTPSPEIKTSNTGRRYVDIGELLGSESAQNEIRRQAATDVTTKSDKATDNTPVRSK